MLLLNFGHPLRNEVLKEIETTLGQRITEQREIAFTFDHEQPFAPQARSLLEDERIHLTPKQWQTETILVNPPTHSLIAVTLLAELEGRMGYLPAVLRLRPEPGSLPTRFVFAEIINLHQVRDQSRTQR
jgi:hypothetical protein